ncbi:MAG TPA: ABC transporter substrate-binding protein [Streptosporangiaceae bacterium]|jgi:iron complex transport system substrate-binding protein|nr:ABC transporter substrate-binding protein [Streptosporangiaceae bacterium]
MRAITRQLSALVAGAAMAAALAACTSSSASPTTRKPASGSAAKAPASFPVTVTTTAGTTHLTSRPGAIVSLSPTATEMLYAIGAGSQVKAVDDESDYPQQAPMTKLSGFTPNVEAIAAYKPDLVIISNNIGGITAKLKALSIPVLDLPAAANLPDVYAEFTELGAATGHVAQATATDAALKTEIKKIVAAEPAHAKPLTYYYEISTNPYYSVTSSTFIGSLLSLLGMKSIADAATGAAAAGGYPSLSAEYILKASPDYIILADTGKTGGGQDAATVTSRPGWSVLTAVKGKHIILLNPDIASRWGPRIIDLLRDVAAGIKSGSQ